MSDICVIGSFVIDTCVDVDKFPLPGQTVIAKGVHVSAGGKGCNQCVAAARLGADCEMIGMLGKDAAGESFLELLKEEGIQHDHVELCDHVPTGFSQIQIDACAENKIVVVPGANYQVMPDIIDRIAKRILHSRLIVLQMELPWDTLVSILSFCKNHQKPVLLNPAPAKPMTFEMLDGIDYITPNETELSILSAMPCETKEEVQQAAISLLQQGVKHVVATLGSKGCVIADADGVRFVNGYFVEVKDTVAAGDAFNGALAKGIVEGVPLDECALFANAVGALTVTRQGAITSLPSQTEVEEFIRDQKQEVA